MADKKLKIGITIGDPRGVGPEITAKAWAELPDEYRQMLRIYGDRSALEAASSLTGTSFDTKQLVITSSLSQALGSTSDAEIARVTLAALDAALADIEQHKLDALVTCPLNKHRLQEALPDFTGHTEYLAHAARVKETVMFFSPAPKSIRYRPPLRIALATTHLPLKDVAQKLSIKRISSVIALVSESLQRDFGVDAPRIAVLGLNPHAGEQGSFGREEIEIITPAIEKARSLGASCFGPFAGDALFSKMKSFDYDAVVAMYHDQGLIPMKLLYRQEAVNITLGLSFIRTAPGHGTAEDIAWRGRAHPAGLLAAIAMAEELASRRKLRKIL